MLESDVFLFWIIKVGSNQPLSPSGLGLRIYIGILHPGEEVVLKIKRVGKVLWNQTTFLIVLSVSIEFHGRFSRAIIYGLSGGCTPPPPPITHTENCITGFLYKHVAYPIWSQSPWYNTILWIFSSFTDLTKTNCLKLQIATFLDIYIYIYLYYTYKYI